MAKSETIRKKRQRLAAKASELSEMVRRAVVEPLMSGRRRPLGERVATFRRGFSVML